MTEAVLQMTRSEEQRPGSLYSPPCSSTFARPAAPLRKPTQPQEESSGGERSGGGGPALCPSAQPDWEGAQVFGVVGGSALDPRLAYLTELLPVTDELLALTSPALPVEVLRTAAPCQTRRCLHHDGQRCSLARRVVEGLPEVTVSLPPCRIRARCQWWQQEGRAACLRCPQVVTLTRHPPESLLLVGTPPVGEVPCSE